MAQLLLEAVGCFTAQAECQSRAAKPAKRTLDGQFRPVLEKGVGGKAAELPGRIYKKYFIDFKRRKYTIQIQKDIQ